MGPSARLRVTAATRPRSPEHMEASYGLGLKGATLDGALFVGRTPVLWGLSDPIPHPFAPQDFRSHPIRTPESGSLVDTLGHQRSLVGAV